MYCKNFLLKNFGLKKYHFDRVSFGGALSVFCQSGTALVFTRIRPEEDSFRRRFSPMKTSRSPATFPLQPRSTSKSGHSSGPQQYRSFGPKLNFDISDSHRVVSYDVEFVRSLMKRLTVRWSMSSSESPKRQNAAEKRETDSVRGESVKITRTFHFSQRITKLKKGEKLKF